MEIIFAILFGIIEGITEWLPVSSTGHMILLDDYLKFPMSDEFMEMFLIVIQLGAIMAVVILYFKEIWPFRFFLRGDREGRKQNVGVGKYIKTDIFLMWIKIVVACIPAVILELAFGDKLEEMFYNSQTVSIMLVSVGIIFILVENWRKDKESVADNINDITFQIAFFIGVFQLIAAAFPGTSRSGATILGGLILGLSRKVAAEFTFYLAIPVMFGASLIKLIKFGIAFSSKELIVLLTGMIVAFVVSLFVIKFLMQYIKKHDFKIFGWYRIILGIIVFISGCL